MAEKIIKEEIEDYTDNSTVIETNGKKEEPKKEGPVPSFRSYLKYNLTPERTPQEIADEYINKYSPEGDDNKTIYKVLDETRGDDGKTSDYTNDIKKIRTNGKKKRKKKIVVEDDDKDPFGDYTDDDTVIELDTPKKKEEKKWYQGLGRKIKNAIFKRG